MWSEMGSMFSTILDALLWRTWRKAPIHSQTRVLKALSCSIRVRDTGGDNKALIFFCDPPVTIEAYDDLIACFHPKYRIIVVELPAFGFSKASKASVLRFDRAVEEVESVLKGLNLTRCILFGPCVCGFVATELVKRNHLPVSGIVLIQTPDLQGMLSWIERMDPNGWLRIPFIGQLIVRFSGRSISKFWLKFATPKNYDATDLIHATDTALSKGGSYPLASILQQWPMAAKNANLNVPALAIWGKQDRSHRDTLSSSTCHHVPDAKIIDLWECGHFPELEQPKQFFQIVDVHVRQWIDADHGAANTMLK